MSVNGKKPSRKFIVTGGAGFIGSHIADSLLARGDEVVVIDDLSNGSKENINPKACFIRADIRDKKAMADIIIGEKPDGVFHAAAIVSVQFSIEHPEETFDVNVNGAENVCEAAHKIGAKVVFSSSSAVYGEQNESTNGSKSVAISESFPLAPKSPYGEHKKLAESYADISLRYFNVYGPRQRGDSPYAGVIARFTALHNEGKPLIIFGDGSQTRDFVNVHDVVRANLAAMDAVSPSSGHSVSGTISSKESINIGSGVGTTVKEIARLVGGEILYASPRIEPKHSLADISKARRLLGWSPSVFLHNRSKSVQ